MPKGFHHHKLLLDEHLSPRQEYEQLNHHFDLNLRRGGMNDPAIYTLAVTLGRIIVTANGKDFRPLVDNSSPGVIDVPADWADDRVDTKLTALFKGHSPRYFGGKYIALAAEEAA
jgi:hypothetical protein